MEAESQYEHKAFRKRGEAVRWKRFRAATYLQCETILNIDDYEYKPRLREALDKTKAEPFRPCLFPILSMITFFLSKCCNQGICKIALLWQRKFSFIYTRLNYLPFWKDIRSPKILLSIALVSIRKNHKLCDTQDKTQSLFDPLTN